MFLFKNPKYDSKNYISPAHAMKILQAATVFSEAIARAKTNHPTANTENIEEYIDRTMMLVKGIIDEKVTISLNKEHQSYSPKKLVQMLKDSDDSYINNKYLILAPNNNGKSTGTDYAYSDDFASLKKFNSDANLVKRFPLNILSSNTEHGEIYISKKHTKHHVGNLKPASERRTGTPVDEQTRKEFFDIITTYTNEIAAITNCKGRGI